MPEEMHEFDLRYTRRGTQGGFEGEMKMPEFPPLSVTRHELEEFWRLKLEESRARYQAATTYHRTLRNGQRERDSSEALARARQAESLALAEYTRLLRLFTDLTVHGKLPGQDSAASSGGA
jgi:hypothetical protein